MSNLEIYAQINEFIQGKRFDESYIVKAKEVKQIIDDILKGKRVSLPSKIYPGCAAKECAAMSDAELLLMVLKSCSEDVLLEIESQFGKKSKISEMIREKILNLPKKKNSTTDTIMTLESMLKESEKNDNPLYSIICKYMDEKGFESDSDFYNSISMSRQNFARIRNKSANIGKDTILWIICGLGLDYVQAHQVLSTAGYTFKSNNKRDVIISYIIKNIPNYNIDTVNDVLYHFGLRTFFDD